MTHTRPLTDGEVALARTMFGDSIDYARAGIANRKWAFFQPRRVVMAPTGCIHFNPKGDLYHDDFACADLTHQALFIHEMTHVWQYQSGLYLPIRRHPFCRYGYTLVPGRRFERYGIEQQAEIARHAFLLRNRAVVPGAPAVAQYETVLPFG